MTVSAKTPFSVQHLARLRFVGDPRFSPDGTAVACVVAQMDEERDVYRSSVWVVGTDGNALRQLTNGIQRDFAPRWSPDGERLAFLSNRWGSTQVWLIDVGGGEARGVTSIPSGAADPRWHPDGVHIAFLSRVVERPDEHDTRLARVITTLRYRTDEEGYLNGMRWHLFVINVETGEVRQLTSGDWDDSSPAWSPDGRSLAFVSSRNEDRDYTSVSDLWTVPFDGGKPRRVTASRGPVASPAWSPDGEWLAYRGHEHGDRWGVNHRVYVVPSGGGAPRCLTAGFDRSVGVLPLGDTLPHPQTPTSLAWSPQGDRVFFQTADGGNGPVCSADLNGNVQPVVSGGLVCRGYAVSNDPQRPLVAYVASTPTEPGDIYVRLLPEGAPRRLTDMNGALLSAVALSAPETIRFPSSDGAMIEGWVLRSPGFTSGTRYPMVLQIHGGPHYSYGNTFMYEFQLLAAQGIVVLYTNPRGSLGYGEAFDRALESHWGEMDHEDLMAGVDHVIEQGYVDPERLGVTGGSYGGYLTNWAIGHTDRFRAAVTDRCETNMMTMWGTADHLQMRSDEAKFGRPYEDPQPFLRHSPLMFVHRMRTPLLIIHGEADYRCTIVEAEQLFSALKRLGREVVFVRYPGENHDLSRSGTPSRRLDRAARIVEWFRSRLTG